MFSLGFDWFNVWFGSCTFLSLGDSILDQCFFYIYGFVVLQLGWERDLIIKESTCMIENHFKPIYTRENRQSKYGFSHFYRILSNFCIWQAAHQIAEYVCIRWSGARCAMCVCVIFGIHFWKSIRERRCWSEKSWFLELLAYGFTQTALISDSDTRR